MKGVSRGGQLARPAEAEAGDRAPVLCEPEADQTVIFRSA